MAPGDRPRGGGNRQLRPGGASTRARSEARERGGEVGGKDEDHPPMAPAGSKETYERHLAATAGWLLKSIDHGKGGSCAYFWLPGGWSRPYPETSGYLIPT